MTVEEGRPPTASPVRSRFLRAGLVSVGLLILTVGIAGFVIPGLPGTPLLLVAAWLFSLSNDRLYRWMMTNRFFGRMLSDYRAGLGIPRKIKAAAVTIVIVVVSYSSGMALEQPWLRVGVAVLGIVGIWFILSRPTRELTPFG